MLAFRCGGKTRVGANRIQAGQNPGTLEPVVVSPPEAEARSADRMQIRQGDAKRARAPAPANVGEACASTAAAAHRSGANAAQHQCRGDQREPAGPHGLPRRRPASRSSTSRRCASRATAPPRKPRRARSACSPAMRPARPPASPCGASPAARSTSSTTESGSVRRTSPRASWIRPISTVSNFSKARRR